MFQITQLYNQIPQPGQVNSLVGQSIAHFQSDAFFRLAYEKQRRRDALCAKFAGRQRLKVFISNNLRQLSVHSPAVEVAYLDNAYFRENRPETFAQKCAQLDGAIVIVNNNDAHERGLAENYVRLFNACTGTLFIVWDWDNHHWLALGTVLAAHSDLYVPTHPDHHYQLSRFNAAISEPVAAGTVQWTRQFLESRASDIGSYARSDAPLGRHIMYGPFLYRNQVVTTLGQHYPSIGFSTHQFHELTPQQKFDEWCSHKAHWIVPVLNDIPIRVFDAFVTGGIPVVPESLHLTRWLADAHADDVVFYSARDVIDPQPLVAKISRLFDQAGPDGMARRFHYGLERHHGDARIREMLGYAARLYGFAPA